MHKRRIIAIILVAIMFIIVGCSSNGQANTDKSASRQTKIPRAYEQIFTINL